MIQKEDISNHTIALRRPKYILRITFPNGDSICFNNATATFIETLKQIGPKRFPEITLEIGHLPLISRTEYPKYKGYMKPITEGWFVNTQSDSEQKFLQLRSISDALNLNLIVEIGTDFEVTNEKTGKLKKTSKNNLLVQFPNGEFVAGDNPVDTFIQSIWNIGIDELQRKGITLSEKSLITRTKQYKGQIQVGPDQWLTVPNNTKDKAKQLRIISSMMHIELKISIL